MNKAVSTPVLLELASLPREHVGPFLLLGVEKTASKEQVEASWARRVILARKSQIKIPLEDINWAREVLNDQTKRIRADAASLNLDAASGTLRRLTDELAAAVECRPLDQEKDLSGYEPPLEKLDAAAIRAAILIPEIPMETPATHAIFEEALREPVDPWNLPVAW
jgi:hypothetical protein